MKNTKRFLACLLAFVLVLGLLPATVLNANAAALTGLSDSSIGISANTASNWTVGTNSLSASITGKYTNLLITKYYAAVSDTLTITNNKSGEAVLSFKFSVSGQFSAGSTVTVDGTTYSAATTNAPFEKTLAAGASVTVKLNAARNSAINTIAVSISELSLVSTSTETVDTTFEAPAYGSYTVAYGDTTTTMTPGTASVVASNLPTVKYTFTATPGSGNKLVGWYNVTTGKYVSMDATYTAQFDTPNTIKAVIVPSATPVFYVGGTYITGFQEAIDYATAGGHSQIALAMNGTVPAGNYTLPAGMTLLLPRDSAYTAMGATPTVTTSATTPSAYRTLTFADGANLTVNGTIECEAELTTMQGATSTRPHGGRPCGPYGAIYMSPNSSITLNSGANMYVWGYVYGDGTVTALSGSKVYESMQVTDFLGGSNLSNFVDASTSKDADGDGNAANDYLKSFFTSQYYVQNIEVALTINAGATEYIFASMTVSSTNISAPPVEFIGANGMFRPQNGSVTKDYDPSTDRLIVDIDGDATIKSIVIDMSNTSYSTILNLVVKTDKFDSSNYILSLNSNITINANSGTITMEQDAALAPGVEIYIAEGATLKIAQGDSSNLTLYGSGGHNIYVYDYENWGGYVFGGIELQAASYSPTSGRYKRTAKDLKDVIIDVNGTVICDGFLYTTVTTDDNMVPVSGGASIISSKKTGSIVMNNGAGIEEYVYRLAWSGSTVSEDLTSVASAWLKNGDGTYLQTAGAEAGAVFAYCADHDCWYTGDASNVEVTDPTCTEGGYTTTTCICGATSVTNQVAALGHSWAAADCDSPKTCTVCGATEGAAAGHSYESVTVEPTCDAKGSVTYTCTVCGHSYTEEIAALGHSYESVTVEPTCDAKGSVTYTCTVCGHSYTEEIAALGHSWTDATCTAPKTCSVCGVTEGEALGHTWTDATCTAPKTCSVCGATEGEALGHSYESVTVEPTCDAKGSVTYTCTVCGDSYTEEIAALGHSWTDATCTAPKTCSVCGVTEGEALGHSYEAVVTAPDCVNGGYTTYTCTVCGDSYVADEVDALGHSWTDATCTAPKTCSVCGATEGEALGHSYESVVTAPTCTEGGYTTYTCSVCGDSYVADEVDALGHTWLDATCTAPKTCSVCGATEGEAKDHYYQTEVIYYPTCGDPGLVRDYCMDCGWENFVESAPYGEHSYEGIVTDPTCTEGGYTTYTCTVCGDSYVADEVDALGHSWTNATCTAPKTCSVCGATEGEALDHSYEIVVTAPDCVNGGYTTYTCTVCGDSYVADEVDALGHSWTDATCTAPKTCSVCGVTEGEALGHSYEAVVTAPTCTEGGYTTYTCTVCGDSYVADEVDALGHASVTYSFVNNVHTFTCDVCGEVAFTKTEGKKFAINSAAPVLADDIVMKYNVTIPAGFENAYMVFDFNGESFTVTDYEIDASTGRYAFKFPGINPQKMGDNICATVYATVDGYQVSAQIASYSMVKYLDNQLKKATLPADTRTIFSDVLAYGEAAQILQGYKTDALVTTLLSAESTLTPSSFPEALDASLDLQKRTGTADSRVQFTGVTLSLGSKMAVRVSVTCTDLQAFTYKVEISGREYTYTGEDLVPVTDGSDGKYYLYFNQVKASELDQKITFTCWEGETQVSYTIEYSVYTFVYRNYTKASLDENTKNMLKAIYVYGESVKNA